MTNIKVPFIDLIKRYEEESDEILQSVDRVLSKGHLVLTEEVKELEKLVCDYTGSKHCISLNSGTDALMIGMWAMGIEKGDEVITTPVSFVASTSSIAHIGATPVYADVRDDQNIDPSKIEQLITPKTKAIMPVHWVGRVADMDPIIDIAKRHNLKIIEDAAQTMGAYYRGQHGGTFGDCAAVSAHPLKNLNAIGDAGFLLTNDDDIAEKAILYRNHGQASRDNCVIFGVNSRLDVINAEILKFRLKRLDWVNRKRRENANTYRQIIKPGHVFIPEDKLHEQTSYVMFITQAEDRDRLQKYLLENGVESLVYYGTPLHLHEASKKFGYGRGDLPVAEKQCDRVLALPHMQYLSEDQVSYAAELVNKFYGV
ncbi:DegT/DnrJ/EryC1/StrS family aminotransferase [Alphaproteobacteria bacterium]|nr:DegT/DnrJ/EryC1/StrS family aminotransferase [Alphaproteobacteria bacterium]